MINKKKKKKKKQQQKQTGKSFRNKSETPVNFVTFKVAPVSF